MIDIPLNKALVAVEVKHRDCRKCPLLKLKDCRPQIACAARDRKDGKNVIFKLVDLPEEKQGEGEC